MHENNQSADAPALASGQITGNSGSTLDLTTLPDEILQAISQNLDAKSLINLGSTARRFLALSNDSSVWKAFCQNEFRFWNSREAFRHLLRDANFHTWKNIYQERFNISRITKDCLNEIVKDPRGRSDRIQAIVEHGYRSKDALLQAFRDSPSSPNHLAQRYWSHVVLGCLHRSIALEEWTKIKYRMDTVLPTERGLAAFDMFILGEQDQGDIDDIFDRLDDYVEHVRAAYPDLEDQTPKARAITIASYLRDHKWVGMDEGRQYHSLDNKFLGMALFSKHNNSIPLITGVIYSYVANKFGLRAQPISFPMHVHVLVQPPKGIDLDGSPLPPNHNTEEPSPKTHLYMNPFEGIEPVTLSALQARLRFIDPSTTPARAHTYLSPATHRDLIIRSAHNILNNLSMDTGPTVHPLHQDSAIYAAFFALVLFPTHPATLRTHLTELTQHFLHHFDHDIHIFHTYILPLTSNLPDHLAYRNLSLQLHRNDLDITTPKLRALRPAVAVADTNTNPANNNNNEVKYRVGSLFRHRRRGYLALIYGWDVECAMTQQWISMNGVDQLPGGRKQPFYNVLVIDDRSTRYVAQENVVLLGPRDHGGNGDTVHRDDVESWPIEIGKWMKRFVVADDQGNGWRFESNVRDEYPED